MNTQDNVDLLQRLLIDQILGLDINGRASVLDTEHREDGYVNMLNKYGTTQDTSEHYQFKADSRPADELLSLQYTDNGMFAKIIDVPADEAVKRGVSLNITDTDAEKTILKQLDRLDWEGVFSQGIKWARLFGGGLAVMIIDDGGGLDEPLNFKKIKSIDDIYIFERPMITPGIHGGSYGYGRVGEPEYYTVSDVNGTFTVHASRCLPFRNTRVSQLYTDDVYRFWGIPEYTRIKRDLQGTITSHGNSIKLIDRNIQAIYKMKDLAHTLSTEGGDEIVLRRMQVVDMARGILNSLVIDAEGEDYDFKTAQLSGVKDILDGACNMLSAVTNIPQTILFGRSPAGENATGDGDFQTYYNYIEQIQKRMLKSNLIRLIDIIIQSLLAKHKLEERPDYELEFPSLWSLSETEQANVDQIRAQTALIRAQTAQIYCDMQALDPSEVRSGLAEDSEFNIETLLDDIPDDQLFASMPEEQIVEEGQSQEPETENVDADDIPTAAAVIVLRDGRILCGIRKESREVCGPGGHIEKGESPIQAAIRETQEEFGITPMDLMYMGTQGENGDGNHCTAVYLCTSFSGTPKADGKEMHGALFLSPDTLDEQFCDNLFPPFADSMKMLKSAQIMQTLSMDFSDGCGIIKNDDFKESDHPRDENGQFTDGRSNGKKSKKKTKKKSSNDIPDDNGKRFGHGLSDSKSVSTVSRMNLVTPETVKNVKESLSQFEQEQESSEFNPSNQESTTEEEKNIHGVSPSGRNHFEVRGFSSTQKMNNHWFGNDEKHMQRREAYAKDGITTVEQYGDRALELIESPVGGSIFGHADGHGNVIRYDREKNDFDKGNPKKGIHTMFKPKDGERYYEEQLMEDLNHGGRT